MILLVGGIGAGKRAYAEALGYTASEMEEALECIDFSPSPMTQLTKSEVESSTPRSVLLDAQELVRDASFDIQEKAAMLARTYRVVAINDVGCGIVPLEREERGWRERVGLFARELAKHATSVVRLVCGIASALKGPLPNTRDSLKLVLMRHGETAVNERRAYCGSSDVALTPAGERQALDAGVHEEVLHVYTSTLIRAQRTAKLCFPCAEQHSFSDLCEMNFGDFEGRSAHEMENDEAYRRWVASGCETRCPNGEIRTEFIERTVSAVREIIRDARERGLDCIIIVAHGGTVMATMDALAQSDADYFDWHVGNCEGYVCDFCCIEGELHIRQWERFSNLDFLLPEKKAAQKESSHVSGTHLPYPAHRFFQNRACKYFPCHEGVDEDEFNCLFCYCPLYALGSRCGGDFTYTSSGKKNCSKCVVLHRGDEGNERVAERFPLLLELAMRRDDESERKAQP